MAFKRMFDCVEVHEGEPMRVIVGGVPFIPGETIYEQMLWLRKHDTQLRKLMLKEPRGVPAECASLLVPAKDPRAKAGFIIMLGDDYGIVSGATALATATVMLETGMIPMQEPEQEFYLETGAGLMKFFAKCADGKATQVSFCNAPCFPVRIGLPVQVPQVGTIEADIVWGGGAFFVFVDIKQIPGLKLEAEEAKEIMRISALCTQSVKEQFTYSHPLYPEETWLLSMLYKRVEKDGVDFITSNAYNMERVDLQQPDTWTATLDRGVCGNGTGALVALEYAKGNLKLGETFVNEGLLGLQFEASAVEETMVGEYQAVIPKVGGQCWISGYSKWILEERDPFQNGFTIGDIW